MKKKQGVHDLLSEDIQEAAPGVVVGLKEVLLTSHTEVTNIQTGFIIAGAGVKNGVVLDLIRPEDVAPTVGTLLGNNIKNADGNAYSGVFRAFTLVLKTLDSVFTNLSFLLEQKTTSNCRT